MLPMQTGERVSAAKELLMQEIASVSKNMPGPTEDPQDELLDDMWSF